jgi:sterol desaturase/sphingolipid hydroxylase (fatty acid hydroxylase superfamily)
VSLARYQVHHSKAERRWNRNCGEVFALWDSLFGTLCLLGPAREAL